VGERPGSAPETGAANADSVPRGWVRKPALFSSRQRRFYESTFRRNRPCVRNWYKPVLVSEVSGPIL